MSVLTETDVFQAAGGAVGALAGYLIVVDAVAYLRDPLRAPPGRPRRRRARARTPGPGVTDVSADARRQRNRAARWLVVQLAGLCVAVAGAFPFLLPRWYVYLIVGLAVVWAAGRARRPGGVRPGRSRAPLAGPHRIRVTLLLSAASVLLFLGLLSFMLSGLDTTPSFVAALGPPVPWVPVQIVVVAADVNGVVCMTAGVTAYRYARRLGSLDARRMLLRDTRSPVLYLRWFGDDGLTLRLATLSEPSLIARVGSRRFDSFEEVLVRHLSPAGPVVALNPPGTTLAPLGAARETLDPAQWQPAVASWMEAAARIVIVAPSRYVTQGLRWELETVSAHGYWDKTLLVVPPVLPEHLRRRWRAFLSACPGLWPFTCPLPAEDADVLTLSFRGGRWTAITADRRSEWSYGAALRRSLQDPQRPAPGPVSGRRARPRS